jgi:hypothetical protein
MMNSVQAFHALSAGSETIAQVGADTIMIKTQDEVVILSNVVPVFFDQVDLDRDYATLTQSTQEVDVSFLRS